MAILQQEPRGLAAAAQCISFELQHRRGWPEGWIGIMLVRERNGHTNQRNIMTVIEAHSAMLPPVMLNCSHVLATLFISPVAPDVHNETQTQALPYTVISSLYRPYFWNSQSRLSSGHTCLVLSHREMQ